MTTTRKRLLLITVLTLILTACLCFAVGCDGNAADNSVPYSVTVKADEAPASGVRVTVKKGGTAFETKTTDKDGKVTFKLVPDSYAVTLSNLPVHYGIAEGTKLDLTAEAPDLTIALAKNFGYTVKFIGPDDKPYYAEGMLVGVCTLSGNCLNPTLLGTDGSVFIEVPKGEYHAKVMEGLPHNVAYECDEDGYYTGKNFSATDTEMTIKLHAVTDVLAQTEMTKAEKETYAETAWDFDASKPAYKLTGTLKPGETKYYSITPAYNSVYTASVDYYASYLYNGKAFQIGNQGNFFSQTLPVMQAGDTYYFNVSNINEAGSEESDITFECVISAPSASYHEVTGNGTVTVTLDNKDANAIIALTPKNASAYKLTIDGDELADIVYCPYSTGIEHTYHETFTKNATASAKVTTKEAGTKTLYFAVAAQNAPTTLKVKVEKLNDITDTNIVKHVSKTLTDFADQGADKELTYVPLDGSVELYYDETNGYYTLGEGGPIVVVRLTKAINDEDRFYADGALAYLEYAQLEGGYLAPYLFDATSEADLADLTKGNTTVDYRIMLRGFAEYDLDDEGNPVIPENITEASYYAKHVNKDGVYPLTKELEEYLKLVAENYDYNMPQDADYELKWLFACYYYADYTEADAIIGEYEFVSYTDMSGETMSVGEMKIVIGFDEDENPIFGPVGTDEYKLVVTKLGAFEITQKSRTGYTEVYTGVWKNENGTYKFTIPPIWEGDVEIVYTVEFNKTTGAITISDTTSSEKWQFTLKTEAE